MGESDWSDRTDSPFRKKRKNKRKSTHSTASKYEKEIGQRSKKIIKYNKNLYNELNGKYDKNSFPVQSFADKSESILDELKCQTKDKLLQYEFTNYFDKSEFDILDEKK